MSGGKRDDDPSEFEAAMGDVERLAGRDRKLAPVPPRAGKQLPHERESVRFEGLRNAERLEGRAPGIDRKLLRRLRKGAFEVELRIDLHGLLAAEARECVREALLEAFARSRSTAFGTFTSLGLVAISGRENIMMALRKTVSRSTTSRTEGTGTGTDKYLVDRA